MKMTMARNSSIWYAVFLAITTHLFSFPAHAQYGGGSGEPNDPYLIYTAEHLNNIGAESNDWDKHFKLMADIDLGGFIGTGFNIIGTGDDNPFIGVFNGNDHTISNFSCDCNGVSYIGLFGNVGYADRRGNPQIRDLGLIDPNVDTKTGRYVGSLVGHLRHGNITGCYAEGGRVSGSGNVGGLVGRIWWGTITNCYSLANVTGGGDVAGLVGYNYGGTVVSCFSNGNVTGNRCVGGLVGWNNFFGEIINCYAAGDITGDEYVGGLVGRNLIRKNRPGRITNCYSVGRVTGTAYVGGLVASNWGTVEFSFWDMENSRQTTSDGATGKTTAEMQTAGIFLEAGWDFVGETNNGTDDIWWILEGRSYPRFWWQYGQAFSPYPQDGAADVPQPLTLRWSPGGFGLHHDVYFGEDKEAVANATNESSSIYRGIQEPKINTYDPGNLNLEKTYYWRIDEVNQADPNSPVKSDVWCFTTANFIVVDDFESYDFGYNQIWRSWLDGYGYGVLGTSDFFAGNGTGSLVGEIGWIEETIAHSGNQAMPYEYYNNRPDRLKYSEANLTLSYPRDWTEDGVSELSLWFRGNHENACEAMYVAVTNSTGPTAVVNHDDPNAAQIEAWTEWKIDLRLFADQGVNLTDVDTLSIGFGDRNNPQPGGSGKMYFDDIRLYRPRPAASLNSEGNVQ